MNPGTNRDREPRPPRRSAWAITLAYIAIGTTWVVASDIASLRIGSDAGPEMTISLIKGVFWIVASGLLLHILVFNRVQRARMFEHAVQRRLLEGEEIGRFGIAESIDGDARPRWSEGMFRLWGRRPELGEPDGAWIAGHIHPADLDRATKAAEAAARGEEPGPYEVRIVTGEGIERDLRITTRIERAGGRLRTLTVAQDVSEARALERNAAESLALLRAVMEATADGLVVLRNDTREILLWNGRFVDLTGIARDAIGRLDDETVLRTFAARVRDHGEVMKQIIAISETTEERVDLIELTDGTILERHTAPVMLGGEPRARIWTFRDVTDRTRAQEALERSERQLAEAQKIAHVGSFEWDFATDETRWSDELYRIYGVDPARRALSLEFMSGMTFPKDAEKVGALLAAARTGASIGPATFRIVRPDGATRIVEGRGHATRDAAGIPLVFIGTIRDVTNEELARRAIEEAEERFRATFEQAAVGIAHLSPDRVIVRANETLCQALGFEREEIIGRPAASLIHPDDQESSAKEIEALLRGESPSKSWQLRFVTKQGESRWAEVTVSAARLGAGSSYLIAVVQDITDRKTIEEERERLARQVSLLLSSTGAGLFTVDLEGRCTLINRAAREALGFAEREIVGRPIRRIVYGSATSVPPEAEIAIEKANAGQATKLYNQRFIRHDGTTLPVDITVSPIFEDGRVIGRAVSFVDVSDRMRLEEQLEKAKRLSGLGRLAASIAHEINNVLMGILPFAEIVTRSKEPVFRNAGEQIRQSVQRGRGVTQEILRFARDEVPQRQVFEGRAWLRSIAGELQEIAGPRAWSLQVPDQPFYLDADPPQIAQVLINLVVNARDAADPERGRIELAIDLAKPGTAYSFGALPNRGHRWIAIRVTDNGAGMDADTLRHLFEPFFTKKRGGTGLGLPIAYKIVAAHEGLLFVESTEGRGSSFYVFLPEAAAPASERAGETEGESQLTGDVLLVEDDETVAAGLSHVLEDSGMSVRLARTGAEALATLERARPSVVVLDVGLPDIQGEVVCEKALARWPGLPIVFSTGHADASRLGVWLEKPNVRFLMKPYTFEQLSEAIQQARNGG